MAEILPQDVIDRLLDEGNSKLDKLLEETDSSNNNGGSTDYYKLKPEWVDLQDVIEDRQMSFAQGNILKAAFTFNTNRHSGTNSIRDLNKIIYFANRELNVITKSK